MEKPAWSNESNSLFCSAPSVTKKPTGRLAQSGYRNAPPLVTKKLMDRISKKNLLSKICMVQYVQYLFLKAWMTQITMNNYLLQKFWIFSMQFAILFWYQALLNLASAGPAAHLFLIVGPGWSCRWRLCRSDRTLNTLTLASIQLFIITKIWL